MAHGRMIRVYDRIMRGSHQRRYYGNSGFFNFGYWSGGAKTQAEACAALVDRLVAHIAGEQARVLDVACGLGASTRQLAQSFPAVAITGINISEKQIGDARLRAPGSEFRVMNATALDFPDEYFDVVICVEAAFHFDTREQFLCEALRVLRPGGTLVLSDILFRRTPLAMLEFFHVPRANLISTADAYRDRLMQLGFEAVEVVDATQDCLGGFRKHLARWPLSEWNAGRTRFKDGLGMAVVYNLLSGYFGLVCRSYLLVSALKPGGAVRR